MPSVPPRKILPAIGDDDEADIEAERRQRQEMAAQPQQRQADQPPRRALRNGDGRGRRAAKIGQVVAPVVRRAVA